MSVFSRPHVPLFEAAPASGGCFSPRRGCCMHSFALQRLRSWIAHALLQTVENKQNTNKSLDFNKILTGNKASRGFLEAPRRS